LAGGENRGQDAGGTPEKRKSRDRSPAATKARYKGKGQKQKGNGQKQKRRDSSRTGRAMEKSTSLRSE
jgi:hypothetical protein